MRNKVAAWIVLGIITIIAGLSLAVTNEVTKAPIAQQAAISEERAKRSVMPQADAFEELTLADGQTLFVAKAAGEILGYVGKVERNGYGGPVEIIAGVKADGTVTGISVGGTNFSETPGLGAKSRESSFTQQFVGKQSPIRLGDASKPNEVDAITASTITSSAVVAGVNSIAKQVNEYLTPVQAIEAVVEGITYAGEADGFKSPVYVEVTATAEGIINAVKIGDERFAESAGFGAAALEADFAQRFIGKSLPLKPGDIDGISGSTMTTDAVILAINTAFEKKNIISSAESPEPEGITYTGEAEGFKGPVYVEVTINDHGSITALKIGDDRFSETDGFGAAALEPIFAEQFIGKALPLAIESIDGISGSTFTTKAVVDAINTAYNSKNPEIVDVVKPEKQNSDETPVLVQTATENSLVVSKDGFMGPITVKVIFAKDGSIVSIKIGDDQFAETPGYGASAKDETFAQQFIGKIPPLHIRTQGEPESQSTVENLVNIDTVTSATKTMQAILDAINEAFANRP